MTKFSLHKLLSVFALLSLIGLGHPCLAPAAEHAEVWGKIERTEAPAEEPEEKPVPRRKHKATRHAAKPSQASAAPAQPSPPQGPDKLPVQRVKEVSAIRQGAAVEVKVSLEKTPGKVLYFSLVNPTRLVVDIHSEEDEDVKIKGQLPKSFSGLADFVPKLRVNAYESKIRLVFELTCKAVDQNAKPSFTKDGKSVSIRVEPSVCASAN